VIQANGAESHRRLTQLQSERRTYEIPLSFSVTGNYPLNFNTKNNVQTVKQNKMRLSKILGIF
jgi:hypothetical protein